VQRQSLRSRIRNATQRGPIARTAQMPGNGDEPGVASTLSDRHNGH
jgi:hypothetical protein